MSQAIKEFERQFPDDTYKAEKKWNERDETEQTWPLFKEYWKEVIHDWETRGKWTREAKQAYIEQVDTLYTLQH